MTMQRTIRVAQWATGGVGKAAIQDVLAHPELELVGAWVHSADKHGRDVGEIIGGEPVGVLATTSQQEILDGDADCVVYSPLMPDEDEVVALLRAGQERRHAGRLDLPGPATTGAPRRRLRGRRLDAARHRHPPRRDHRAVPAHGLGAVAPASPTCGPRSSPTSAPTAPPT